MYTIIERINSKINELNYRINQMSYSDKNVKFYYAEKISEIREEIKDLQAQLIFYNNYNNNQTIDIHGATTYFVYSYLYDLIIIKRKYHQKLILITGKGSFVLFNATKKFLDNEEIKYKIDNYKFIIY